MAIGKKPHRGAAPRSDGGGDGGDKYGREPEEEVGHDVCRRDRSYAAGDDEHEDCLLYTSNKYFFGLGTVGRDMFYAFESNALLYYLSNVLSLPVGVFAAASLVLTVLRILDALNDPITAVSYTHLDVYKRQALDIDIMLFGPGVIAVSST